MYKARLQSVLKNLHYDEAVTLGSIFDKMAELGKLTLQTELCYWGYQYNDGDCNEVKYPCVRNELCKMKAEVCRYERR